ncbi:conjugative transfer signal peptidase TraF [Shewanella frigidimarina]|uniref:conjugative transfer signal peptidase TraF n=1 Tax=Shewanella frigidimarina TaxID=56812 RepID=UPI003D7AD69E
MIKILSSILLFLFLIFSSYQLGIRINNSQSYPPGIYLLSSTNHYDKNELILFCPPANNPAILEALERDYIDSGRCDAGTVPIIKRIVGLEGDSVKFTPFIEINNVPLKDSIRLKLDGQKRQLPQIDNFTVPPGHFFAYSEHAPKYSFDSRYFGPVPIKNILGKIKPLILFPQ